MLSTSSMKCEFSSNENCDGLDSMVYEVSFVQKNLNDLEFLNANQSKSDFNVIMILHEICPRLRYPPAKLRQ